MADNKKQEKDYTKEVDALLPEAEAIVKVRSIHGRNFRLLINYQSGKLHEGLDKIFALEKQTRNVFIVTVMYLTLTYRSSRQQTSRRHLDW